MAYEMSNIAWERFKDLCLPVSHIPEVSVFPENRPIYEKCLRVLKAFFTRGNVSTRSPLKGFLFEGPPGTGKTELVKQIARGTLKWYLAAREQPFLLVLDGASIASPKWGDAEETLRGAFSFYQNESLRRQMGVADPRVVLLFDDIESLMLARSSEIAKEWHFSINAVLFHCLDGINASRSFVFATTNRPDLIDEALRDRLYSIKFVLPSRDSLLEVARQLLNDMGDVRPRFQQQVLNAVENHLAQNEGATIRDVERWVMIECVERGVWEQ